MAQAYILNLQKNWVGDGIIKTFTGILECVRMTVKCFIPFLMWFLKFLFADNFKFMKNLQKIVHGTFI